MKRALSFCFAAIAICLALMTVNASGQGKAPALKKTPPKALELFNQAGIFQNNQAFELGAEEWSKFLKMYPDVDRAPKAQYYLGICQLQLKRYPQAAEAFQTAITKYPTLTLREDAYLNLGWCQYTLAGAAKEDAAALYDKASQTFAAMLKEFPPEKGKKADQAYFFLGEALYAQGKRKEAVAAYDPLVKSFPKSSFRADGVYALGTTHEELEQYPQAGVAYDLFLKEFPKHPLATEVGMRKAETILQAGVAAQQGDDPKQAGPLFAAAEKMFAASAAVEGFASVDHALFRQAFCLLKQEQFEKAAALYAKIPAQFTQSNHAAEATISAARAYYQAKKFAESQQWFQKVLAAGGDDAPEAAHWICRILLSDNKPAEAATTAAKALPKAVGGKYEVNLKMDQADGLYAQPQERAKALALYTKIADDHPKHEQAPQARYNAAFAALELKQYQDGLKQTAAFLAAHQDHSLTPDVQYVAAECQLLSGKYAEAEKLYTQLTGKHGKHKEIELWQLRLAETLRLQQKNQEIVALMTPLVGKFQTPAHIAEGQFLLGASQLSLEKHSEAGKALAASLAADPKWRRADETLLLLSRAQSKTDQLNQAIQTVKKMLADFPDSNLKGRAHYRLGEYSYTAGDFKTAATEYQQVLTIGSDTAFLPYSHYGHGWSLLKQQQYKPAVAAFTALLDKYDGHKLLADARFARALCLRQDGEFKKAIADINEYLKSNPPKTNKSNALFERGQSETALKQHAAAAATFTALLKDDPQYAAADQALYELAWANKEQGKNEPAIAAFTKLAAGFTDSRFAAEANFHVGEDHYDNKRYAEAVKSYTASKAKADKGEIGEKAAHKLGWSHYLLKQYDEALKQFADQIQQFPKGALKPDGLFMKAETLFRLENYKEALPAYKLAKTAVEATENSSPDVKVSILLHAGQAAGILKQWDESLALLQAIPANHADSFYVPEAHFGIGRAQQNLNKTAEALAAYEKAADGSRGAVGARARFRMGELHFTQKKYDDAVKQFQRAMFGYGGDMATADVKDWQAKSGYEAARCHDVQIMNAKGGDKAKHIAEAIRLYRYVTEKHPTHALTATAKKRLAALGKLQ